MTGPISWWKLIGVDPAKNKNPDQQDLFLVLCLSMLLVLPSSHWHSKESFKKALSAPWCRQWIDHCNEIANHGTPRRLPVYVSHPTTMAVAWQWHDPYGALTIPESDKESATTTNLAPWWPCSRWGPCKLSCSDCKSWRMTSQRWRWIWIPRSIEGWGWWGWWGLMGLDLTFFLGRLEWKPWKTPKTSVSLSISKESPGHCPPFEVSKLSSFSKVHP